MALASIVLLVLTTSPPLAAGILSRRGAAPRSLEARSEELARTLSVRFSHSGSAALPGAPDRHRPYVVVSVFSGRRDREEILLGYLQKLLRVGSIDEILLTITPKTRNATDRLWLSALAEDPNLTVKDLPASGKFGGAYDYLATTWTPPAGMTNNTVVVKCDDDIVYVDLEHFDGYVRYAASHPEMFLVFANIVNNQVAAHYQWRHGAFPSLSHGIDMQMPYPGKGFYGTIFERPETAVELHRLFLASPGKFSWKVPQHGGCIVYRGPAVMAVDPRARQTRFSINFFAFRYGDAAEVARLAAARNGNDEMGLTSLNPHTNCMYTEFVVSHFSFELQQKALEGTDILERYAKLKDRLV